MYAKLGLLPERIMCMSVKITSVDKGSPADKAKIKAGEGLFSINGL